MNLKKFQYDAADEIARRYAEYIKAPLYVKNNEIVPFYQNLSSITGSGKTLIL